MIQYFITSINNKITINKYIKKKGILMYTSIVREKKNKLNYFQIVDKLLDLITETVYRG
jgi:hypothetical protein